MSETPPPQISSSHAALVAIHNENKRTWTVARCNRLLRPLTTSLKRLRDSLSRSAGPVSSGAKIKAGDESDNTEHSKEKTSNISRKRKRFGANNDSFEDEDDKASDSDWEWPALKKRPRHRYRACRRNSRQVEENRTLENQRSTLGKGKPGEMVIPTPIFRKAMSRIVPWGKSCEPESPIHMQLSSPSTAKKSKSRWSGFKSSGENSTADEVIKAFSNILEATTLESPHSRPQRVKSLFALCIQQVPNYIAAEAYWRKLDDPADESNVTEEIFTELESLGSAGTSGWKHLRLLVRSQSILMLQELMEDLGTSCGIVTDILNICYEHSAFDEASQLLSTLASASAPFSEPPGDGRYADISAATPALFSMLDRHSRKSGSSSFQSRVITQLISSGSLPLRWITSGIFKKFYIETTLTNISLDSRYDESGVMFIASTLAAACGLVDGPMNSKGQAISSSQNPLTSAGMIAFIRSICNNIICAAILAHGCKRDFEKTTHSIRLTCGHLIASYQNDVANVNVPPKGLIFHKMMLLSNLILNILDVKPANDSPNLACQYLELLATHSCPNKDIASTNSEVDDLVQLLDHLVRFYSNCHGILIRPDVESIPEEQLEINDAFHLFQRIAQKLLSFALEYQSKLSSNAILFAQRLTLESTMHFADTFGNSDYEGLYLETEKAIKNFEAEARDRVSESDIHLETDPYSPMKWRWDDGICEFVAKTPRPPKKQNQEELGQAAETDGLSVKNSNVVVIIPEYTAKLGKAMTKLSHVRSAKAGNRPPQRIIGTAIDKNSLGADLIEATSKSKSSEYGKRGRPYRSTSSEISVNVFEEHEEDDEIYDLPVIKPVACQPLKALRGTNKSRIYQSTNSDKRRKQIDVRMLGSDLTSDELA